jgi:hypothetical protein
MSRVKVYAKKCTVLYSTSRKSSIILFGWPPLSFKVPQEKQKTSTLLVIFTTKKTPSRRTKAELAIVFLPDNCDGFRQ